MHDQQIKILCTNIRSLGAHYDALLVRLQTASVRGVEYDFVALSETWVKPENLKLFPIKNYVMFSAARIDGRKSGGVVLYM